MRREFPAGEAGWVRLILVIGVLASLCFSVGEGLRLLPLPELSHPLSENAHTRPHITTPSAYALNQFQAGSITQPPQAQKTLKRKQAQCTPASPCFLPLPNSLRLPSGSEWRSGFYLTGATSRLAGRAPPRIA